MSLPRIGIVAPSSVVPSVEFQLGIEMLKTAGFPVKVHRACRSRDRFFAGSDETRAKAFFEFASDPTIDVLWCARGGYGATRLLPILEEMAKSRGRPHQKTLVGFSDATVLCEFTRVRWGWRVIHASMPGLRKFCLMKPTEWKRLFSVLRKEPSAYSWKLKINGEVPKSGISGILLGGNLAVWTSLMGTRYQPKGRGKILFFEDVDESLYRIDRMVQQIAFAGGFEGIKAVVLGNFSNCRDVVSQALVRRPRLMSSLMNPLARELKPIRPKMDENKVIPQIFSEMGERFGFPVAYGLPVGHGPGQEPLELGVRYLLNNYGIFTQH